MARKLSQAYERARMSHQLGVCHDPCPVCKQAAHLTPEGLEQVETIRSEGEVQVRICQEIGKGGEVIIEERWERQPGEDTWTKRRAASVEQLAAKVLELKRQAELLGSAETAGPSSIKLGQLKWNLKKARQRLRRYADYEGPFFEVADDSARKLMREVLEERQDADQRAEAPEFDDALQWLHS